MDKRAMPGDQAHGGPTLTIGQTAVAASGLHAGFARLDGALLAQIAPARVICPLFDADCDAMAVAERLAGLGWHGLLTVLAPGLPNRRMVEQELRASAPGLRVEVVAELQDDAVSRR